MILACQNINKAFGDHQVLKNASFHVEEYEKTAVIGINGAGKSTLLKIIMGDLPADSGQVIIAKGKTIGYLAQHQDMASSHTIFDELLTVKQGILDLEARMRQAERDMKQAGGEKLQELMDSYARMSHEFEQQNGYAWKSEITGVLKGLGFTEEEFGKQVDTLSGGQKTRVALGKLLLSRPDIILLDEPSVALDPRNRRNLIHILRELPGMKVIASHDMDLIWDTCSRIICRISSNRIIFMTNLIVYPTKYITTCTKCRITPIIFFIMSSRAIQFSTDITNKLTITNEVLIVHLVYYCSFRFKHISRFLINKISIANKSAWQKRKIIRHDYLIITFLCQKCQIPLITARA